MSSDQFVHTLRFALAHLPLPRFRKIVDGNYKRDSRWWRQQRGARGSGAKRSAVRGHGRLRLPFVQRRRRLAAAAVESAAYVDARSPHSLPPFILTPARPLAL